MAGYILVTVHLCGCRKVLFKVTLDSLFHRRDTELSPWNKTELLDYRVAVTCMHVERRLGSEQAQRGDGGLLHRTVCTSGVVGRLMNIIGFGRKRPRTKAITSKKFSGICYRRPRNPLRWPVFWLRFERKTYRIGIETISAMLTHSKYLT
jgi:hypothetical protein